MAMPEAKENWRQGVDLIKKFLRMRDTGETDEHGGPLYSPGLYVDYSCLNTIREFNNYRAPAATGERNLREAAQAYDDHALDALRYGLVHLFELGAKYHLSDTMPVAPLGFRAAPRMGKYDDGQPLLLPDTGDKGIFTMEDQF
jgi:hypothetical protein